MLHYLLSQITNISGIERLQDLHVVSLEASSIREPFLIRAEKFRVGCLSQFDHFVKFLSESLLVRSDLSQNLITIEAENKLRLIFDSIMSCNFRRNITIDFDDLQKSVLGC